MTIYYVHGHEKASEIFNITETSVGPFTNLEKDPKALKDIMQKVDAIDVEYYFINHLPLAGTAESTCYKWEVV